jgi:predicted lipoprotein with Yx(FWY)xxD motif
MSATLTRVRRPALFTAALLIALAAATSLSAANRSKAVVRTAKNATLAKTILVNLNGRTLYGLSVEVRGKFICTDGACLAVWHPLVVGKGVKPTGAPRLATVRRPDGRIQDSYKGRPPYTFSGDKRRGDAKGEGLMDVGTWHAAAVGSSSTPAPTTTSPGGYGP